MEEVLVDRFVPFVDEVSEVILELGGPHLPPPTAESIHNAVAALGLSGGEMETAVYRETQAQMSRFRAEVEEPAEEILRSRKASNPSAVEKVAVDFGSDDGNAALYREALDCVEPCPSVAAPPQVTSLGLRVSWSCASALRHFAGVAAFISSTDHNVLVLYVGSYRPCYSTLGFYLVYDVLANSVAVVPQLPLYSASMITHGHIGSGVAVLRHTQPSDYVLVELLPRLGELGFPSNKATLFMWWSSGPLAGAGWVHKELVLPIPSEPDDDYNYFRADTVFAIGSTCLCWVDLLQGMLICDRVLDDHPEFCFVPLPEGYPTKWDEDGRGDPQEYRSMCCVDRGDDHIIRFLSMDGHENGFQSVILTTWTLEQPCGKGSPEWKKGKGSFCVADLWSDPMYKHDLLLPEVLPRFPVLSMVQDHVVYLAVHGMTMDRINDEDAWLETGGWTTLSFDMQHLKVLSAFKPPPGSRLNRHPYLFCSNFTMYLNKKAQHEEDLEETIYRKTQHEEDLEETVYWVKRLLRRMQLRPREFKRRESVGLALLLGDSDEEYDSEDGVLAGTN